MGRSGILKNCFICTTGQFSQSWKEIRIQVPEAGGHLMVFVDDSTTHLVASLYDYTRQTLPVKIAMERDDVCIVTERWLFDSLRCGKKLPEKPYLWKEVTSTKAGSSSPTRAAGSVKQRPDEAHDRSELLHAPIPKLSTAKRSGKAPSKNHGNDSSPPSGAKVSDPIVILSDEE